MRSPWLAATADLAACSKPSAAQLLILDDWGISVLNPPERRDLLDILDDRHGRASTVVTSQVPVEHWHDVIGNPTIGDAILDRLVHNAHRLQLSGESMQKQNAAIKILTQTQTPEPITLSVKTAAHDRAKYLLIIA
jgi:hypothetical protein